MSTAYKWLSSASVQNSQEAWHVCVKEVLSFSGSCAYYSHNATKMLGFNLGSPLRCRQPLQCVRTFSVCSMKDCRIQLSPDYRHGRASLYSFTFYTANFLQLFPITPAELHQTMLLVSTGLVCASRAGSEVSG